MADRAYAVYLVIRHGFLAGVDIVMPSIVNVPKNTPPIRKEA